MRRDGWKVGELFRRTGISVRALHYDDEIGHRRGCRRGETEGVIYALFGLHR